jgi:hypothetical protein
MKLSRGTSSLDGSRLEGAALDACEGWSFQLAEPRRDRGITGCDRGRECHGLGSAGHRRRCRATRRTSAQNGGDDAGNDDASVRGTIPYRPRAASRAKPPAREEEKGQYRERCSTAWPSSGA